jgi:hypothetical protein
MDGMEVRQAEGVLPIGVMHKAGESSVMDLVSHDEDVTVTLLICQGLLLTFSFNL